MSLCSEPFWARYLVIERLVERYDTRTFEDLRLVYAASETEAEEIYERWWESKSEAYSHSYFATGEALETLGSPEPKA